MAILRLFLLVQLLTTTVTLMAVEDNEGDGALLVGEGKGLLPPPRAPTDESRRRRRFLGGAKGGPSMGGTTFHPGMTTCPPAPADIDLKIERHFPCGPRSGPKKENMLIKFPNYKVTGINFKKEKDEAGHSCIQLGGGKVEVAPPGLHDIHEYILRVEMPIGIHGKQEQCVNPESCRGHGSCAHCALCQSNGRRQQFVQLVVKGDQQQPAECSAAAEGALPAGTYDNLYLNVCLPSKEELLPFLYQNASSAEQIWALIESSSASSCNEISLVVEAHFFDRPINKLPIKEQNDALYGSKKGMIGCHWIYATMQGIKQSSSSSSPIDSEMST